MSIMSFVNQDSSSAWNAIDWAAVQETVSNYQSKIFAASRSGKRDQMHGLQRRLITSNSAKQLAIRSLTEDSQDRKTSGVDDKVYLSPVEKIKLLGQLNLDGKAEPIRRVYIPKPGKSSKRPLGIPLILDRAKQKLVLIALQPSWEARFEPNSFGFWSGTSSHDASNTIILSLPNTPKAKHRLKYIL